MKEKNKMKKDVKPYKQRGNTCAIVCMMMVLEYYDIIEKANWYDENKFIVCDPLYKMKQMRTFEEIDNFMNTSIGKWFISVNNKNRNSI